MNRIVFASLAGLVLLILCGCAIKSKQQITASGYVVTEPTPIENLEIYNVGENIDRPFKILGKVWARMQGNPLVPATEERLLQDMKPMASQMGADAIFSLYFSNQDDYVSLQTGQWGSGLAIKYLANDEVSNNIRSNITIGIRPWAYFGREDDRYIKHLGVIADAAQYFFEKKGYHAVISEAPLSLSDISSILKFYMKSTLDSLSAMPISPLDRFYGHWTEYVLLLDSVDISETPEKANTVKNATCLKATLFSKSIGGIVWENYITADFNLFGRVFEGGKGRGDYDLYLAKVYKKIKELFKNLPEVNDYSRHENVKNGDLLASYLATTDSSMINDPLKVAFHSLNHLLYGAVRLNDTAKVGNILNQGADINSRRYNGNTSLHSSSINGQYDMTQFLLDMGADASIKNADGKTPLEMVLSLPRTSESGIIIQLLENHNAAQ